MVCVNNAKKKINFLYYYSTTAGFEPARPWGNALAGHRVNHSAKLP